MSQEFNEMEHLERQIIKRYNELLKTLLEEGDMDTLERWEGCYTFPLFVQCEIVLRASLRR